MYFFKSTESYRPHISRKKSSRLCRDDVLHKLAFLTVASFFFRVASATAATIFFFAIFFAHHPVSTDENESILDKPIAKYALGCGEHGTNIVAN